MPLDLLAIGALSLVAQVVLLRELSVASFGSELVYILALGAWLAGTASGAVAGQGTAGGETSPRSVPRLFLAVGLLLPLALAWTRGARPLLGAVPGAYLPLDRQLLALALAVLPVAFVFGRLFRLAARAAAARGLTLARAYALESAGALAGGAAATLALRAGVSNLAALLACALAAAGMARPRRVGAWLVAACLAVALAASPALDRATTAWTHAELLATRDSPYGRVTLSRWGGQLNVFENDALAYETGGTAAEEFVTVAALAHPAPRRILILGGGATGLVAEALAERPRVLDSVELDAVVERLVESALPPTLRAPLAAPAVRLFVADPRRFLTRRRDRYDLILVGMPEPASGQANRYYTREFFAECAERLRPRGIVAFRLPAAENLWAPALVRRMASIDGAARTVFPDVLWLPGTTSVVLASQAPLPRDPDTLAARLAARGLTPRLVTPAYLRYLWTNDRTAEIAARLAAARSGPSRVPANSDARPICYQFTLILWLAKFVPGLAWMPAAPPSPAARGAGIAVGLALLAALWLVTRRRAGARRAIVVGAAGAVGMVTESLLLVAYQARAGVLYQDLGLLLMAFMAGLAAGAALADRLGRSARLAPLCSGEALLAALAVMGTALAAALGAGIGFGLLATGLWLAVAGALTAGVFAVASRQEADQAAAAGPLYAADLAGGCVGSLAASLLLIPLLGFVGTAATVAIVALLATAWA